MSGALEGHVGGGAGGAGGVREPLQRKIELAWRVHEVNLEWLARVDQKAWILLAFTTLLAPNIITLSEAGGLFASVKGGTLAMFAFGCACLVLAALCAVAVVVPNVHARHTWSRRWEYACNNVSSRMQRGRTLPKDPVSPEVVRGSDEADSPVVADEGNERPDGHDRTEFIYFGHLKDYASADHLASDLRGLSAEEEIDALARQLYSIGHISWRKHWLIRAGFLAYTLGALLLILVAAIAAT